MAGRVAVLLLVVSAATLAPSAAGSPARNLPIRLGVGIGPINLGMTGQQVRRAIGRPRAVIERRVIRGLPYVEFEYQYGAWNIGLLGRKGHRRVVVVGTGLTRHRTPEGLGVDSTASELYQRAPDRVRSRRCFQPGATGKRIQSYLDHSRSETHFYFPATGPPDPNHDPRILTVEIRAQLVTGCLF